MTRPDPVTLLERLLSVAEQMVQTRDLQISDAAIRHYREEVTMVRMTPREDPCVIGYEASNLVECIAAIAYARSDRDPKRESRAIALTNTLRPFLREDLNDAKRSALQ